MSCEILLDNIDTRGRSTDQQIEYNKCPGGQPDIYTTINRSKLLIYLSLFARTIFNRRLRYFKVYLVMLVVLMIILFILARHHTPTSSLETDLSFASQPSASYNQADHQSITKPTDDLRYTSQDEPVIMDKTRYRGNNSITLRFRDFVKMKRNVMQIKIREATKHAWSNYKRYAWGFDMLKPRAKAPDHWFDLGLTIVDGADTLIMMGLLEQADDAINWIENNLKFNSNNTNSNCFELTIRILAGLLSTYHLTNRHKIKEQALHMADILLHCYDTDGKIVPYSDIDLKTQKGHPPSWLPHSSLSEVASIQLEFRFMSQISGDPRFENITFETSELLHKLTAERNLKLLPMYINPTTSRLEDSIITLGARADSYYEYLLKQYIQTGIDWLQQDYLDSVDDMSRYLFRHTNGFHNFTYVAEMIWNGDETKPRFQHKMDHLVCFLPGTLALGYYHFSPLASDQRLKYGLETPESKLNKRYDSHLSMAKELARTCYHMYSDMATGLAPEIATFVEIPESSDDPLTASQPELQVSDQSSHNILRPEFVESLFYLYHITGSQTYRNQGQGVFEAFEKYSRIPSGYTPIADVRRKPETDSQISGLLHETAPDRMESFWLSETLKYLYLLFVDDNRIVGALINNYVFNTEGHIIPV